MKCRFESTARAVVVSSDATTSSPWETLPHSLPPRNREIRRQERLVKRRHYPIVSASELNQALAGAPPSYDTALCPVPKLREGSRADKLRRPHATKRAAILDDADLDRVLDYIKQTSRSLESDRVKVLLSFKAGLRVGEIAELPVRAFTTASGTIGGSLFISGGISKSLEDRTLTIHPQLAEALQAMLDRYPHATHVAFSIGRGGRLRRQSGACLANWFARLFKAVGLVGCSSHSGRRTFATKLARIASVHGKSIHDVQALLGHRELSSTQCYLEPSASVEELINAV